MPDGKYVNRKWITYNEINKKNYCSICMASLVQIVLRLLKELK